VELSRVDSNLESTHQDSILKSLGANFGVRVIMINYVFIETNESMLKRQNFICTFETICIISAKFMHLNFDIKERIIHFVFRLYLILLHCKNSYIFLVGEDEGKY
jgi:hypothetical protein